MHMRHTAQRGLQARIQTVLVTKASVWEAVCKGVTPQVLSNFLVLGLPGGVMMAADACSFDVTTVMASILGQPAIATSALGGQGEGRLGGSGGGAGERGGGGQGDSV